MSKRYNALPFFGVGSATNLCGPGFEMPQMQRRAAYLLVLFWALALALVVPSHSISYAQKDEDKVPKSLLKEAKKAVGKVKKPDYAAVNAIRYLLNREQDVARLPFWRENLAIPSLGTTKVLPGEACPKWLSIRLAALIRAGMTLDIELEAELKIFFETNVKTVFDAAAGTVEMLVIDAILNREEDGFSKWKNEARQRAGEIYKTRKWHDGEFGKAPDLDQVARFVDDLIARLAFQRNGFPKPEGSALEGARSLANFVLNGPQGKGVLWHAIDGGVETKDAEGKVTRTFNALPRAQGILMLLIANSLAAQIVEEGQAPIDLKAITPALSYHCRTLVIGDDKADYAGMCQEGATAVFTALVDESLLTFKGEKKPKKNRREEILKNALLTPASLYQTPKLSDMGLSYLLGWHPDASRLAAGQENHATIDERGLRIALALLAKSGGLFANEKSGEIMPDADLREVLTAITTLEISETPQTFEDRVNLAIDRAATQLLSQQENDGSFSGRYKTYPGGQALYLLALLDAGVPRDSAAIRKGISKLRSTSTLRAPTYAAGIILMMLQKY
ncbi:MAG: hypothetical protein KDB07_07775, partial [Planctomycetes bacterium]|nr:hypothetical protein [Planctomycetota bacterium]